MRSCVRLLGLDFADTSTASAAALIAARPPDAAFGYVVTPNADHLVRMHRYRNLRALYDDAWLRLLDSRVVGEVAHAFGLPTPSVAPGSDLTSLLFARYVSPADRITIIGLAARWLPPLLARYGLAACAHYDPPRGFERDPAMLAATVDFVLAHPARYVFLAVGSPRQEILADAIRRCGRATGSGLCIGASLEFLAGAHRRAPRWMQRSGLEWLYRLGSDPVHMARRYLIDSPAVIPLLLRERLRTSCAASV
ncbi:MAG TPA: WecB/TagA/CpsF family glycosyltransferase [Acetobacteraceae bacterium]|nr:WecB/TagA/CpsF family glycosyltransferase [Acetobacteraceae bacterium]